LLTLPRSAAGDRTGRITLRDGTLRHHAGVLRNVFPAPLGDTPEAVSALAFSPDGRTLAVAGDAGGLQLWDVSCLQPLGGPRATARTGLVFGPGGSSLYAGSTHVPLQRYVITAGHAITRVCARAGGGLTRVQWRTYIPDAEYREIC
jgi:WD40 repeat protein